MASTSIKHPKEIIEIEATFGNGILAITSNLTAKGKAAGAKTRHGASITLTPKEARQLSDALGKYATKHGA